MTSYQISQEYSFQSLLWAISGAIHQAPSTIIWWAVWLSLVAQPWLADLSMLLGGLLTVLAWTLGIAAIIGAVALLLAHPLIVLALLGIAGYAYVTYPRKEMRK